MDHGFLGFLGYHGFRGFRGFLDNQMELIPPQYSTLIFLSRREDRKTADDVVSVLSFPFFFSFFQYYSNSIISLTIIIRDRNIKRQYISSKGAGLCPP